MAILHAEALWDNTKLGKAKSLIKKSLAVLSVNSSSCGKAIPSRTTAFHIAIASFSSLFSY